MSAESPKRAVIDEQTGKTVVYSPGSREYVTSDTGEVPAFRDMVADMLEQVTRPE